MNMIIICLWMGGERLLIKKDGWIVSDESVDELMDGYIVNRWIDRDG